MNYFKVARWDGRRVLFEEHYFFSDTDPDSAAQAYAKASGEALHNGAELSVWKRPRVVGAWSAVNVVGDSR